MKNLMAETAVLYLITVKPRLAQEVREQLEQKGFSQSEARTAIAKLWDEGKLNVGLDQKLRPTQFCEPRVELIK